MFQFVKLKKTSLLNWFSWNRALVVFRFLAETANRAAALITFPLIARYLGATGYGVQAQTGVIVGVLLPIATLGLGFNVVRLGAGRSDLDYVSRRFLSSMALVTVSGLSLTLATLLAAPLLNALFIKLEWATPIIRWYAFLIILTAYELTLADYYRARLRIAAYSVFQMAQTVLNVGGTAFILVSGFGLLELTWWALAVKATLVVGMMGYLLKKREVDLRYGCTSLAEIREMFWLGLPVVMMGIGAWVFNLGDRMVVGYFMKASDVGVYNSVYNLSGLLLALASPLWAVLYPLMATGLNQNNPEMLRAVCRRYTRAYAFIALPALFGLTMLSPVLLRVLGTEEFKVAWWVAGAILLGVFIDQLSSNAHYLLYLHNEPRFLRNVSLLIGAVNLLLNFAFVPYLGIFGSALATLASFLFLDALLFRKIFALGYSLSDLYDLPNLGKILLASLVMSVFVGWVMLIQREQGWLQLIAQVLVGVVSYFTAAWMIFGPRRNLYKTVLE